MSGGIYRSEAGAQAVQTAYRSHLDHWPLPHREIRVPTREGETFVVDCGPSTARGRAVAASDRP